MEAVRGPGDEEDTQPFSREEVDRLVRASVRPPAVDYGSGAVVVSDDDGEPD